MDGKELLTVLYNSIAETFSNVLTEELLIFPALVVLVSVALFFLPRNKRTIKKVKNVLIFLALANFVYLAIIVALGLNGASAH